MGNNKPSPVAQHSPSGAWEDVGPRDSRRAKVWQSKRRSREPLRCLDQPASTNFELAAAVAGNHGLPTADDSDDDRHHAAGISPCGFARPLNCCDEGGGRIHKKHDREFQTLEAAESGEVSSSDDLSVGQHRQQEGVVVVVVGDTEPGQEKTRRMVSGALEEPQHAGEGCDSDQLSASHDFPNAGLDFLPRAEDSRSSRRGEGRVGWSDSSRVRVFHDMICVGFVVSLCLNSGSLTACQEGFFTAEVKCLPQGAAQTVLPDLGIWVGWRQAVANSDTPVIFNLEDLSMLGATMGIFTVVGHATDAVLNAAGLAILLYSRRKPLQEGQCRLVKRLCLASLAMAGWLAGMTVVGFLVAVKGPIGAAAVDFYSDMDLDCGSKVSVSVDYAYAMTTLTILCQFFIGVVALPKPSHNRCRCCARWSPAWCLSFCLSKGRSSSSSRKRRSFSVELP